MTCAISLSCLNKHNVTYVLIGEFAVNFYGYVRTTQDIDILIVPSTDNAKRTMMALKDFGFGSAGIPETCFELESIAIHLGVEPNRIDLLTHLKGLSSAEVFARAKQISHEGVSFPVISYQDLIRCKKESDRLKDLADADELEKINAERGWS